VNKAMINATKIAPAARVAHRIIALPAKGRKILINRLLLMQRPGFGTTD